MRPIYAREFKLDVQSRPGDIFEPIQADLLKCAVDKQATYSITNEANDKRTVTLVAEYISAQSVIGGYFALNTEEKNVLAIDSQHKICIESLLNSRSEMMFFIYGNGFGYYTYYHGCGLDRSFEKFFNSRLDGKSVSEYIIRTRESTKKFIEKMKVSAIQFALDEVPEGVNKKEIRSNVQTITFNPRYDSATSWVVNLPEDALRNLKVRSRGKTKYIDISNSEVESLISEQIGDFKEMTDSIRLSVSSGFDFKNNLYFNKIRRLYEDKQKARMA